MELDDSGKYRRFSSSRQARRVSFVETDTVSPGVSCDIYTFTDDQSCDLGIVTVSPGHTTPLQRVLKGESTIEGYLLGEGTLTINKAGQNPQVYRYPGASFEEIHVRLGETMQWQAGPQTPLVFFEICTPPYEDGRFENIPE